MLKIFFTINTCRICKMFSASVEMIIFLSFILWMWMCCITVIDLHILNHPYIPEINSTWSWCTIFLLCFLIQFASILLRIFTSIFVRDIGYWIFLQCLCLALASGWCWPHLEKCYFFIRFLEELTIWCSLIHNSQNMETI